MSKKILKVLVCLAGIAAVIAGVVYFINSKKKNDTVEDDNEFKTEDDEDLAAVDALDLSSLKFSRHYVDLR